MTSLQQLVLEEKASAIQALAPEGVNAERLSRMWLAHAFEKKVHDRCSPASVYQAIAAAVSHGFDPGQDAYLVPYGQQCQLHTSYKGMVRAVLRGDSPVKSLHSNCVYSHDHFEWSDFPPDVKHQRCLDEDRGAFKGVYAVALDSDGKIIKSDYMPAGEIEKAKKSGRGGKVWDMWFDEMAKKTVIRRICKTLPVSQQTKQLLSTLDKQDSNQPLVEDGVEVSPKEQILRGKQW